MAFHLSMCQMFRCQYYIVQQQDCSQTYKEDVGLLGRHMMNILKCMLSSRGGGKSSLSFHHYTICFLVETICLMVNDGPWDL